MLHVVQHDIPGCGIAKAGMGPGTSPVIFENLLILQCDQEMGDGSFIVALDRKDGREVWRQVRTTRRTPT